MIKIFNTIKDKLKLNKENKEPQVTFSTKEEPDSEILKKLNATYENYKEKSLNENIYYLKGSNYMKSLLSNPNITPKMIDGFFMNHFSRIDSKSPAIPHDLGIYIEELTNEKNMMLGMHKSDSIVTAKGSQILYNIMQHGLINIGSTMQGLIITGEIDPNKTIANTNDPLTAISTLKSSYKNSNGTVLITLPKNLVDSQFEIADSKDENAKELYDYDENGTRYVKPKYIVGYVENENGVIKYYSKEEILNNRKDFLHQ